MSTPRLDDGTLDQIARRIPEVMRELWALGWAVQERPTGNVILHSGGQTGFRALTMASVERKSGFVILTNSDSGGYVCDDEKLGTLLTPLLAR